MRLALFDLDNTLLDGDSDYEWGQFLVERGVLARDEYEAQNRAYYEQYVAGTLDIHEFEHLIATEPESRNGRFTGKVAGTPCFREGKVKRLDQWLAARRARLADFSESSLYSDSHNDLPLLERVSRPVAVDPDERLAAEARRRDWPVISLKSGAR